MIQFKTKKELIDAYAVELETENKVEIEIATMIAKQKLVYVAHIYRGGWVIRGFGYSTERIKDFPVGNPELV